MDEEKQRLRRGVTALNSGAFVSYLYVTSSVNHSKAVSVHIRLFLGEKCFVALQARHDTGVESMQQQQRQCRALL